MRRIVVALTLLGSCSADAGAGNNQAAPIEAADAPDAPAVGADLTGLYEGRDSDLPTQMCVLQRHGEAQFGLVVSAGRNRSCSGSGTVTRDGDRIRLRMDGDSPCTIDATLSGGRVTLAPEQAPGCSYYCGAGATLGGAQLDRTGRTRADALKAKDLVGERLCSDL